MVMNIQHNYMAPTMDSGGLYRHNNSLTFIVYIPITINK